MSRRTKGRARRRREKQKVSADHTKHRHTRITAHAFTVNSPMHNHSFNTLQWTAIVLSPTTVPFLSTLFMCFAVASFFFSFLFVLCLWCMGHLGACLRFIRRRAPRPIKKRLSQRDMKQSFIYI